MSSTSSKTSSWTVEEIPPLSGKTVLITGANSGLGLESAKALAGRGAHVIMACRTPRKAESAIDAIKAEHPLASLELLRLDLASLRSIAAASSQLAARHTKLDILLNNAGIMAIPEARTEDGFEMQFGTNHLGHFALTARLFPLLLEAKNARVISVSSIMHLLGKLRSDDLNWQQGYSRWPAYNMSKLANLLFTYELGRRCEERGLPVLAAAAHPGYSATNLQLHASELEGARIKLALLRALNPVFAQSPAMGALPQLHAATAPSVLSGDYYGPSGVFGTRGAPSKVRSSARSRDAASMAALWTASEQLTGLRFDALSR